MTSPITTAFSHQPSVTFQEQKRHCIESALTAINAGSRPCVKNPKKPKFQLSETTKRHLQLIGDRYPLNNLVCVFHLLGMDILKQLDTIKEQYAALVIQFSPEQFYRAYATLHVKNSPFLKKFAYDQDSPYAIAYPLPSDIKKFKSILNKLVELLKDANSLYFLGIQSTQHKQNTLRLQKERFARHMASLATSVSTLIELLELPNGSFYLIQNGNSKNPLLCQSGKIDLAALSNYFNYIKTISPACLQMHSLSAYFIEQLPTIDFRNPSSITSFYLKTYKEKVSYEPFQYQFFAESALAELEAGLTLPEIYTKFSLLENRFADLEELRIYLIATLIHADLAQQAQERCIGLIEVYGTQINVDYVPKGHLSSLIQRNLQVIEQDVSLNLVQQTFKLPERTSFEKIIEEQLAILFKPLITDFDLLFEEPMTGIPSVALILLIEFLMAQFNSKEQTILVFNPDLETKQQILNAYLEIPEFLQTDEFIQTVLLNEILRYFPYLAIQEIIYLFQNQTPLFDSFDQLLSLITGFKEVLANHQEPPPALDESLTATPDTSPSFSFQEEDIFKEAETLLLSEPVRSPSSFNSSHTLSSPTAVHQPNRKKRTEKIPISFKNCTYRELEATLKQAGFEPVRQKGSHQIFQSEKGEKTVPVPHHGNKPLKPGTLHTILEQAGLLPKH